MIATTAASSNQPASAAHQVLIERFAYDPEVLPVKIGDTVTWTNRDIVPHTVTAEDGSWDSGEIAPGATWSMTVTDQTFAETAGAYFCGYHPVMQSRLENEQD
ncbi:MAG: copper-binding protein [Hyphomicrobiales bacterium]|nr:MAG: copper-binding protein [Hyphomicrobiales bacterium]